MYHPTTRVLTILELLQSHGEMTGRELARRLEVDPRTIRRYIVMLQDMGIPIEAERGRTGAYFLRPGYKLPPLMFNQEEAFAIVLSLRLARQTAFYGAGISLEGASAKIERVLPETIRQQVKNVMGSLSMELNVAPGVETSAHIIQLAATACQQHQQIAIDHASFSGAVAKRVVDPYGLVYRVGRWYLVAYCHLRSDIRTFRLDRVQAIEPKDTFFQPQSVDVMAHVEQAIGATPGIHRVEARFDADVEQVRRYIPATFGKLTALSPDTTHLMCFAQSLPWIAGYFSGIPVPMTILQPAALIEAMRQLSNRVADILTRSAVEK